MTRRLLTITTLAVGAGLVAIPAWAGDFKMSDAALSRLLWTVGLGVLIPIVGFLTLALRRYRGLFSLLMGILNLLEALPFLVIGVLTLNSGLILIGVILGIIGAGLCRRVYYPPPPVDPESEIHPLDDDPPPPSALAVLLTAAACLLSHTAWSGPAPSGSVPGLFLTIAHGAAFSSSDGLIDGFLLLIVGVPLGGGLLHLVLRRHRTPWSWFWTGLNLLLGLPLLWFSVYNVGMLFFAVFPLALAARLGWGRRPAAPPSTPAV